MLFIVVRRGSKMVTRDATGYLCLLGFAVVFMNARKETAQHH